MNELKDDEILDFLMTSDFEGDYKPEELKYLLTKWRYFYRLLHGRLEILKADCSKISSDFEINIKSHTDEKNTLLKKIADLENKMEQSKYKKLTLRERLTGKIKIEDEN